jgi:hypothetical protein
MTRRRRTEPTPAAPLPLEAIPYALMDAGQTAVFLGTTPATLADWRHDGLGPPYAKIGALVRYQLRALQHWVESRTVPG